MSKIIFEHKLPLGKLTVYNDKPSLKNLHHVHQTHSAKLAFYHGNLLSHLEVDGIIVMNKYLQKDLNFAIKTADCIPAVFIGDKGIAIIHAGWKGVRDHILTNNDLAEISPTYCYLGPSIQFDSFEVQEDFYQHFSKQNHDHYKQINDKIYFDLQAAATEQINEKFPQIKVLNSSECTYKLFKYNSFRRDQTHLRNWNIFSL